MILSDIVTLLSKLPPGTIEAIGNLVARIASSPDPASAARRAMQEEARLQAFDAAQRRLRG